MPIIPTIPIPGIVIDKLTYPVKKLLGFAAKNSMQAQGKSEKEIIQDLIKRDNPSFYSEQTRDGGNEIDTYLYGTPYNTENTSNVGPSYENYLSTNFPLKKHAVKTYDAHFGDTLYIDQKYKDQVLDELEQGKTVGASMGRYGHAPSYIVNTKDDERRPYDAGGHLMQFQYDKDGNVIANMSDIYDFLPRDFEEKYGALKEYGPIKTAGMYAMHYTGTPFIVRQNGIPVRFKEIVPEYKTELQSQLGNFLSNWGDMYDLTIPHRLTDEQIEEIFDGKQSGDEILDFMDHKGYLAPSFKKGGSIHIKKKNRGKFTEYCGGKVTEECIAKGKKSKDPKIRKRATFAANARKWKHENGGVLKAQNGVNLYPTYGSYEKAKFAYDAGSRNPEAISAIFADYVPTKAIGKTYSYTSKINGAENDNFQSYFKTTGNNNLGIEQKLGRVNGNETDVTTFLLPNGDTYSENHIDGTSQYNVDYAKRLGMDKLPKPKTLFENGGVLKYQNPAIPLDLPEGSEYGGELEPAIVKPEPYLGELNTYYPVISEYPFTGHSELNLYDSDGRFVSRTTKYGTDRDYDLFTNNCSDATRCAVEQVFGKKINPVLFTTPGDVQDFVVEQTGSKPYWSDRGRTSVRFEIPFATAMDWKNKKIDLNIQNLLKHDEWFKKRMHEEAESRGETWDSSDYDESTRQIIEEWESKKYKFQPFINKTGGILKTPDTKIVDSVSYSPKFLK